MTQKQLDMSVNNDSSYNNGCVSASYNDDGYNDILSTAIQCIETESLEHSQSDYYKKMQDELSQTIRATMSDLLASSSNNKKKPAKVKPYSKTSPTTPTAPKRIQVKNYIFSNMQSNVDGKYYIIANENSNSLVNKSWSLLVEDAPQVITALQTLSKL